MRTTALVNKYIRRLGLCLSFLLLYSSAHAQSILPPTDFAVAQTAFVASAGAPSLGSKEKLVVGMLYPDFFQQLTAWNKYRLINSPQNADIAMEISLQQTVSDVINGSAASAAYVRLDIRDVKTRTLLWSLDEPVNGAFREKTLQHNVDDAVTQLMTDLKLLAAGRLPFDPAKPAESKTSVSQEGSKAPLSQGSSKTRLSQERK